MIKFLYDCPAGICYEDHAKRYSWYGLTAVRVER